MRIQAPLVLAASAVVLCVVGCTALVGGQQRNIACEASRTLPPDSRGGVATCNQLPEFGLCGLLRRWAMKRACYPRRCSMIGA